ncbi:hypothetical protein ILYODFUR_018051, partial [Ilyodon furcidens]
LLLKFVCFCFSFFLSAACSTIHSPSQAHLCPPIVAERQPQPGWWALPACMSHQVWALSAAD